MKGRSRRGANIYIYIYSVKWVSHWQPKLLQHQGLSQRQILTQRAQRRSDCFSTSLLLGVLSPSSNRSVRTAMACPHAWAQDDMASSLPTHGLVPKAMGDLTCKHLWCIDGCKITLPKLYSKRISNFEGLFMVLLQDGLRIRAISCGFGYQLFALELSFHRVIDISLGLGCI